MSFRSDIMRHQSNTRRDLIAVHRGALKAGLNSVKYGSDLTGAPGQPVEEGDLRDSWQIEQEDVLVAKIYTDSPYALPNEDGIDRRNGGVYHLRSTVGGRWSVHKTRQHFDRLVDYVANLLNKRSAR